MPFNWFIEFLAGKAYQGLDPGWEPPGKSLTVLPKTPGYQVGASWNAASYAGASQPEIRTETEVKKDDNVLLYVGIGVVIFIVIVLAIVGGR